MELAAAVTAVDAATRALGQTPIAGVDADEFRDLLKRLKIASSRLEAQVGRLTFAADCLGSFIGTGARDSAEWLGKETGTSTRKNRNATELGQAMAGSDELNEAVTKGDLSADKASIIVGAAGGKPVDTELLDEVTDLPLNAVRPAVENWRTRDQRCRWPGCTIRATWCDAHHITHWTDHGPTNDDNCVLLCHHHHQLSHQPGWVVTGTATDLRIQRPDGHVEISRPPAAATSGPPPTGSPPTASTPTASTLRAGTTGRESSTFDAPTRQLTLV